MGIIAQLPHFYQDKEGKSHRNVLQIETDEPRVEKGYPKDGTISVRLQDELAQKAFKMTPQEALYLGEELTAIAKDLLAKKRGLWQEKARAGPTAAPSKGPLATMMTD